MAVNVKKNPRALTTVVEPIHYHPLSLIDEVEMLARDLGTEFEDYIPTLPMDMFVKKDELVIRMELPGVKKDDIHINLEGRELTVEAERKSPEIDADTTSYSCELCYGCYSRTVTLPFPVEQDKISSKFEDGLLEIRLPKSEEAKSRRFEIKVGSKAKPKA